MAERTPGVTVTVDAESSPRGDASATGTLFVVGITERGPSDEPVRVTSGESFRRRFGRASWDTLTEPLRLFFAEGGAEAWVHRVVGPAAEKASGTVESGDSPAVGLTATSEGSWGDDLTVSIDDGTVTVSLDGDVREVFRNVSTADDLVAALEDSDYVDGELEGDADDELDDGETTLSGGDDDRDNIEAATYEEALERFGWGYGPGQVAMPHRTSEDAHQKLVDHAEKYERIALLDADRDDGKDELLSVAQMFNPPLGALTSTWVKHRGSDGRTRRVPGSMLLAGRIAAVDAVTPTAHVAAAGENGEAESALGVVWKPDSTDDLEELNRNGVIVIRETRTFGVQVYGFRSLSDEDEWQQLTAGRYRMGLVHRLRAIGERYVFRPATPETATDFGNAIKAELKTDFDAGALFGDDFDEAASVSVGEDVNPPEDLAAGKLSADVEARFTPFAERVVIRVTKAAIS